MAQKSLYQSYADAMYNVACRIVRNEADAQDVLQNAFIEVYRNLDQYRYQSTPGAWIKKIVVNKSLTFLKKKNKNVFSNLEIEDVKQIEESDSMPSPVLEIHKVKSAIDELPDGYRTVLNLYIIEGYDHGEISQILGISEATSKSQYSRAKKKLRTILSKNELFANEE